VGSSQELPFHLIGPEAQDLQRFGITDELSISIYKTLKLNRMLDTKILSLQRQGRLGPYIASTGEEGTIVGSAFALKKDDWLFSSYRELGAHIVRGLSIDLILAQLFGNSNDLLKGRQMSNSWGCRLLKSVPTAAPIGAYLPVAVGTAIASKIRGEEKIGVLAYFGDGATSSSDFHVAMNFAGVFRAPIVFFCRNNGWAISVPLSTQTAAKSLAIKARAYGFKGIRVDGNDPLACYALTRWALETARSGGGPTLIEGLTYRIGPHSTSDDPKRYRSEEDLKEWSNRDPISLLRSYLNQRRLWDEKAESDLILQYEKLISEAVEQQMTTLPLPPEKLIFEDVYFDLPWNLKEQQKEIKNCNF
jgi:pyruvate dehydrogenase E1 component alpha subunit